MGRWWDFVLALRAIGRHDLATGRSHRGSGTKTGHFAMDLASSIQQSFLGISSISRTAHPVRLLYLGYSRVYNDHRVTPLRPVRETTHDQPSSSCLSGPLHAPRMGPGARLSSPTGRPWGGRSCIETLERDKEELRKGGRTPKPRESLTLWPKAFRVRFRAWHAIHHRSWRPGELPTSFRP
jgi:hypothetical protein